jgi:LuxR family maltose regulon positive regulatory protein
LKDDVEVGSMVEALTKQIHGRETGQEEQSQLGTLLTDREMEVLELLAARLQNQEIAERLFISVATVKKHTSNLYEKLGVGRRREAVDRARELGILS